MFLLTLIWLLEFHDDGGVCQNMEVFGFSRMIGRDSFHIRTKSQVPEGVNLFGMQEHAKETQRLERELAAATMRATVAEEQLEVTQQYVAQSVLAYQKEIFRLQDLLGQTGVLPDIGC